MKTNKIFARVVWCGCVKTPKAFIRTLEHLTYTGFLYPKIRFMNNTNTPTANVQPPCINFENWGEAFDFAREIINLCECTADNLANTSQNNLNDWEYTELMGANEFSIKFGLQLVKKIIPFTDIEQILK